MLQKFRLLLLNTLGLITLLSLPGIWIAWSEFTFYLIVGAGVGSAILYILLYRGSLLDVREEGDENIGWKEIEEQRARWISKQRQMMEEREDRGR